MYFSSISYFTNANNVEYSWQIQDDNNKKIVNNLPGSTLKYRFDTIGTYIVTLTARSPNGEVDTDSRQITIESRSPVVNLDNPKPLSTESPNVLEFDASKSYDPDTMGRK
ncbi:MAG: PKD domain-containing protein [Patescibacteria group bacterium]